MGPAFHLKLTSCRGIAHRRLQYRGELKWLWVTGAALPCRSHSFPPLPLLLSAWLACWWPGRGRCACEEPKCDLSSS